MKLKISFLLIVLTFTATTFASPTFSLEEASIATIHTALKSKKINCEQLTHLYIQRIKDYDLSTSDNKAPLNAIATINPSAIMEARQLDMTYNRTHKMVGTLYCIPVVLKDNIDTYDVTASSGSLAMLGNQPLNDALLVAQLRQQGAIIIAKTAMDEFASGTSGMSSRNGRIGNAFDTSKNSGGSSGGSAVAISSNFAVLAIGSDNSGSVRIPSAFNGIIGLRPTMGLISQQGIFPRGNLDGTAGPMARTVTDLATMLNIIAQPYTHDPKTLLVIRPKDYTKYLNAEALKGKRIGVVNIIGNEKTYQDMPNKIHDVFTQMLVNLQEQGVVVKNINLPLFDDNRTFNQSGEREDINRYLASFPAARQNYSDICQSERTLIFGKNSQDCLSYVEKLADSNSSDYRAALAIFAKNKKYVENIMKKNKLDALLVPVNSDGIATYDQNTFHNELLASNAGIPGITFPIGYWQNMPVGVELVGKAFDESTLISLAYAYELHYPSRKIPKMPKIDEGYKNLDIPAFNNKITEIGYASYREVITNKKTLTPETMHQIIQEIRQ